MKNSVVGAYDKLTRAQAKVALHEAELSIARQEMEQAEAALYAITNGPSVDPYIYIQAWGKLLGSFDYFIACEVNRAQGMNAPATAIYRNEDGTWHTFEGIESADTKRRVEVIAARLRGMAPENRPAGC